MNLAGKVFKDAASLVRTSRTFLTLTLNVNNSVTFQLRMFPKVANERYCNIFLIFGVVWGKGVKG